MIKISVLPTSSQPVYRQIADSVIAGITSGSIPPGTALPPIRTVSAQLGVSVITVRAAWDALAAEGFIVSKTGSGCFVADVSPAESERARLKRLEEPIEKLVSTAKSLGFTAEETTMLIKERFAKD